MSRYNHQRKMSRKEYVYHSIVAVAAVILLVVFMPRGSHSRLNNFVEARPWPYSTVIAQKDVPLLKSDSLYKVECDSIRAEFSPRYTKNADVLVTQKKKFIDEYNNNLKNDIPFYYRVYIIRRMNEVYEAGILSTDDYKKIKAQKYTSIMQVVEKEGKRIPLNELYTTRTAYEYIINSEDSTLYQKSKLRMCNPDKYIVANLTYDENSSKKQLQSMIEGVSRYNGQILAGEEIVHRGQIVNEEIGLKLRSLQKDMEEGEEHSTAKEYIQMAGQAIYAALIIICLLVYFNQFRSDYLDEVRTIVLILLMTLIFPIITYLFVNGGTEAYLIPYCMVPIFLRVFLDSRTAFITHTSSILLSAVALAYPFEFIFTQMVAGMTAIYSLKQLTQRSDLFRAVGLVIWVSLLCYIGFDLINQTFLEQISLEKDSFDKTPFLPYLYIVANGCLLLITYLLLFPFERIFKFTSTVTLVELSNTNNEILRKLSEKAPGTFQHSMQVANLAAEVANKIGAKSQLVRTAALYHDIGKMEDAIYYTENQNGWNPHERMTYTESAKLIIGHVTKGLELATKHQLPKVIKEFIATHHGTSKTKYFYISYKNEHPEEVINEKDFTYPGPNPYTMEQAILMMADSVEAASRSLKEYTEEQISELVERIINAQVQEGYFTRCPITFEDISIAKRVFKEKLMTIYHTRISYPELKKENQ